MAPLLLHFLDAPSILSVTDGSEPLGGGNRPVSAGDHIRERLD